MYAERASSHTYVNIDTRMSLCMFYIFRLGRANDKNVESTIRNSAARTPRIHTHVRAGVVAVVIISAPQTYSSNINPFLQRSALHRQNVRIFVCANM